MVRRTLRWLKRLVKPPVVVGSVSHRCNTLRLGTDYGGWTINPDLITRDSIIYSAGIGEDASWDQAMIQRFGVTIHGFDPTPRSIAWVAASNMPPNFRMHPYGLAAQDGELVFHAPINPAHVSLSVVERDQQTERVVLPVREIAGIMNELGHDHLDILKMDIEGSEYDVIADLLERKIPIRQLLVEYHHRFQNIGNDKTQASIDLLERHGYRLFNISASAEEYSFLKI
jgi:FkbM family methyltransferase